MKNRLTLLLTAMVLFTANAYAADNVLKNFGNEIKEANKALLNKKVDDATADKKLQINKYKDQQKQEHTKYQDAIKAKKAELAEIKKNKGNMTEQQQAAKEAALQKQIDELYKKDTAMKDSYNKKIEALKL